MPWEENRNRNSLSPHGLKEATGHAVRTMHDAANSVPCNEMPAPLRGDAPMRERPHDAGPRMPVHIAPETRRPVGEPQSMTPRHDPTPHPYTPAGQKQQANTYMPVKR